MNRTRRVNVPGCRAPRPAGPALLLLAACAGNALAQEVAPLEEYESAVGVDTRLAGPESPERRRRQSRTEACIEPGSDQEAWIDRVQQGVYIGVCGAANWFDGLFGSPRFDQDSNATFGRIGVFENWDDRSGLNSRLRLRARLALPAMQNRLRLSLGRGNEQELVEGRPSSSATPVPQGFGSVEDEAWLLGLGYSRREGFENGFDFGAGMRLRFPVDPFLRGSYRWNYVFNERSMLRFRETLFWRDSRGFGATTQLSIDWLLTDELLLRWNNIGTVAEDTEGAEWVSGFTLFQSLGNRRALSYTALVAGEHLAEVPLQNYGLELRYRQRIYRRWLFLQLSSSLTWPRGFREERREINPGVGIGLEMYFGPVPDSQLR